MRKTVMVVASLACALCAKADYVIKQTIENAGKSRAFEIKIKDCLLYTSPSPRDLSTSRMPSSA